MKAWLPVALLALAALPAPAQEPAARRHWSWNASAEAGAGLAGSRLSFDGRFSVWPLLGEPVVNCTARLGPLAGVQVAVGEGGDRGFVSVEDGELEVYGLVVAAMMDAPGAPTWNGRSSSKLVVFCDAGVVAQAGRNGFNVAGSPAWDKLFCAANETSVRHAARSEQAPDACAAIDGRWLPADEARAAFRAGLDFQDFAIHALRVNTSATTKRVEKARWRERSAAHLRQRAAALFDRLRDGTVEGSMRVTEAMRGLDPLPDPPTGEALQAFDRKLSALEARWADDEAAREARERERRALVAAQLERLQAIDRELRREDQALVRYRRELEALAAKAPVPPDPLADALAMEVQGFREGELHGLRLRDGAVLVPPTWPGLCGTRRGLACVVDGQGRKAVVDASGEVFLDFQPDDVQLYEQALECAGSILLTRRPPGSRDGEYALYSLVERRQLTPWMTGRSVEPGDCDTGFRLIESERQVHSSCSMNTYEQRFRVLGYDGREIARDQSRQQNFPNICLRSERVGG